MKQITIISQNQSDIIADITQCLADSDIDIQSITGRNFGENAIVTLTVADYKGALNELQKREDLQIVCEDAIIVRINDETGALAKLTKRFSDTGITIHSIRFIERCEGYALVAISTARNDKTLELVKDILMN